MVVVVVVVGLQVMVTPPLAWPKRGHSPGGAMMMTAVGRMVVVEEEVVVGR
jgi:hypothetical protein